METFNIDFIEANVEYPWQFSLIMQEKVANFINFGKKTNIIADHSTWHEI